MIHGVAEAGKFRRHLGRAAAGQDAPIDFAKTELRLFRREGEVAGEERAIAAAKAPAVDHRDGGLLIPAQAAPPAIAFPLCIACALQTLGFGFPEIFLKVHTRAPRRAFAGQDEDADIGAKLQIIKHAHHLAIEARRHAIALVRAVEADPGDAVLHREGDGFDFGLLDAIGMQEIGHGKVLVLGRHVGESWHLGRLSRACPPEIPAFAGMTRR